MPYNNYNNNYQKQPDWNKINGEKKLDIVKGQTANQLIEILIARMQKQNLDYGNFEEFLKEYERNFPRLLEVNKRLLINGGEQNGNEA